MTLSQDQLRTVYGTLTVLAEHFQELADDVLAEARCTVEWTPETREGSADTQKRHITAPRLGDAIDEVDLCDRLFVLRHEVEHITAPYENPVGKFYREAYVSMRALCWWQLKDLPHADHMWYSAGRRLGTYARNEIAAGKITAHEVRDFVPARLLRYMGDFHDPKYLCQMSAPQLRKVFKEDRHVERMVGRLRDWDA